MKISVLMSVYMGTDELELFECLQSINAQSLPPTQLVIVLDGPIKKEVRKLLDSHIKHCNYSIDIIELSENKGLGAALSEGLKHCCYELVARVDTDDINVASRFEEQHKYLLDSPEISAVGGLLEELYDGINGNRKVIRAVPVNSKTIVTSSRYRNPINHPTVMFRKEDILNAGGYQPILWFEDYYLWARLIMRGCLLGNINKVLVRASADNNYFSRRGGIFYFKQELLLASEFRKIGFHNIWQSIRFIASRFLFRIVPIRTRSWLYLFFLRNNKARAGIK